MSVRRQNARRCQKWVKFCVFKNPILSLRGSFNFFAKSARIRKYANEVLLDYKML